MPDSTPQRAPSSGTGPRLTPKGQATRDRIVAAAAALMFDNGVAATSTEDVRAGADVSSSQIYHYFADKKALVHAVIAHQASRVVGLHGSFMSQLDSIEALEAWRDFVVSFQHDQHCRGGCPIGSLAGELVEVDPDARVDLAASYQSWQAVIRDGLAEMRRRGELRAEADPEHLSLALLAALQGGLLLTQTHRDTRALEAVLSVMIEQVRNYLP